jgi:hypothetical protein
MSDSASHQVQDRPIEDLQDPATYPDSTDLAERCDLVMKGGITSGIIYPHAVCQLAITRRLQRVGGTSAGAIAAAGAAAAEVGRDAGSPQAGFARLAALPGTLAEVTSGGHTRLFHLFQPQGSTKALYRLVSVLVGRGGALSKTIRCLVAAVRALRPLPTLVGIAIPVVLLVAAARDRSVWGIVAAVALVTVGFGIAVGWSLVGRIIRDLPKNHLGLCSGMPTPGSREPALTEWLADEFDRLANPTPSDDPLTFGDLAAHDVELAMFTTDLSAGTQNKLPFRTRVWSFDPTEFRELFPGRVVDWMIAHPPEPRDDSDREVFAAFAEVGLHPLPVAEQLPIIVGVRMSLSFPFLLSTVPLHAFDYTLNPARIVRHRFSDGGITSNFPIHFFDQAIPGQPTFGINLTATDQIFADQSQNVSMPDSNRDGILARIRPVETTGAFAGALRNSVQNWADSMQTRVPGYRDRIVAVKHTKSEGGLNLDMDRSVVLGLAERGRYAGLRANRFDFVNHRWVRLRSFFDTLEDLVVPAATQLTAARPQTGVPTYPEMIAGTPPTSYRNPWNANAGEVVTDAIVALADAYRSVSSDGSPSPFANGAPAPKPQLQIRPRP